MNKLLIIAILILFNSYVNAQKVKESFHPEKPFKQRTDTTIIGNEIHWIFQSKPNAFVTQEYQDGEKLYKYKFRDSELRVGTIKFELTFDKMNFQDSIGFEPDVFTMNFLRLEGFNEQTEELQFFLTVNKPDTDWAFPIYLFVNLNGTSRFELPTFEDDY